MHPNRVARIGRLLVTVPATLYLMATLWFCDFADFDYGYVLLGSALVTLGSAAAIQVLVVKELSFRQLKTPWKPIVLCMGLSLATWPFIELILLSIMRVLIGPVSEAEGGMQMGAALWLAILWGIPLATIFASYAGLLLAHRLTGKQKPGTR